MASVRLPSACERSAGARRAPGACTDDVRAGRWAWTGLCVRRRYAGGGPAHSRLAAGPVYLRWDKYPGPCIGCAGPYAREHVSAACGGKGGGRLQRGLLNRLGQGPMCPTDSDVQAGDGCIVSGCVCACVRVRASARAFVRAFAREGEVFCIPDRSRALCSREALCLPCGRYTAASLSPHG